MPRKPKPGPLHAPPGYGISTDIAKSSGTWDAVRGQLATARNYWLATARPDGRPHTMPVWGLWLDEAFVFATDAASRKARNLVANPHTSVHLESGDEVVILEGVMEQVAELSTLERFVDAYEAKYAIRPDVSESPVYKLRITVAMTWREKDYPTSATRWAF
ncbi:MAG: pyridoxamine 5'-phosphate oxidase family protein [Chloroflexi bacterium]|nr:pyridoxamine 5'-phosphate oxidase family protein [Chloroflexota bacterium]